MKWFKRVVSWFAAICLALALTMPGIVLADDDEMDDDDGYSQAYDDDGDDDDGFDDDDGYVVDDDGFGDDGGFGDDDDDRWDDDDREDDDEWDEEAWVDDDDDDDDDDGDDDNDDDDDDDVEGLDRPIADQAIVNLRREVNPAAFADRLNVTLMRTIPGPNIILVGLDENRDDRDQVTELSNDDDVVWAELNYTSQAPEGRPRYFFTSLDGAPRVVDSPELPQGLEFTPELACSTGVSVIVAVLDTGVDADHPALQANILANGVNMIDVNFDIRDIGNSLDDDNDAQIDEMVGHGTHVSGIILQVAPAAMILPVKVLNSDGVGDDFSVAAGIYYAEEQGASVINLSLGSTFHSRIIQSAVEFVADRGVMIVAAAGNGDREQPVEYPAAGPTTISVASTTAGADKASFSNFNDMVDISAPGENVASAYPEGLYTTSSGTSMSTPLVAGAAALLLEQQPELEPEVVLFLLQANSGLLSLSNPALAGKMGAGELDIDASISCAL